MHFWIDKRNQGCRLSGCHAISATLAQDRNFRRNKPMVPPVHRFQENSLLAQQLRRPYELQMAQTAAEIHQPIQCHPLSIQRSEPTTSVSRATQQPETDRSVFLDQQREDSIDSTQSVWPPVFTRYGMWASFGLTVISLAATKVYVESQGTFEMLLFCTLSILSALVLFSCVFTCKKKTANELASLQATQTQTDIELPELIPPREMTLGPCPINIITPPCIQPTNPLQVEIPPPPYDIAILLPSKENCVDTPPPTYENATR